MNGLTLALRAEPAAPVDLSPVNPAALAGLSQAKVKALPLDCGGAKVELGELFRVSGRGGEALRLEGGSPRLLRVGAGMTAGSLEVHGRVGDEPGRGMSGGVLRVRGEAGRGAAAGMRGGQLIIEGDVGEDLGGPCLGQPHGMTGGLVVVEGDAGARAGDRLRRGIVVIKGEAGALCATRMVGGTVLVLGRCGAQAALGMQRGSLVLRRPPEALPATFNCGGTLDLPFLGLLFRQVAAQRPELAALVKLGTRVTLHCGDAAFGGKGEVLVLARGRR